VTHKSLQEIIPQSYWLRGTNMTSIFIRASMFIAAFFEKVQAVGRLANKGVVYLNNGLAHTVKTSQICTDGEGSLRYR
jgi:hypothetical protein